MSRVMVVEDEPITAADLEEKLTDLGHEVTWFDTGADAIAHAQSTKVDLVLMDVRLRGELSGIDAAQQLCEHSDVPIVFLTAFADQDTVDRACRARPYGYMLKPFTDRTLAAAIQVALTRAAVERSQLERERAMASALQSAGEALIAVDESAAIRFINAPAEALLRVRAEGVLGKDARPIVCFAADEFDSTHPLDAALRGDRLTSSEARRLLPPDRGASLLVSYSAAPLHNTGTRELAGAVLVFREVATGPTRPGSEPLLALDKLSRRLSHEINNPLTYNLGALELALRELDQVRATSSLGDAAAAQREQRLLRIAGFLRDAEEGATRIAGVVRELKLFSLAGGEFAPLQPIELLDLAIGLSKIDLGSRVRLVREVEAAPIVKGDKWQLAGVLAYALRIGLDSLERRGATAATLTVAVGADARGWAELRVTASTESSSESATDERMPDSSATVHPTTVSRGLAEQVVDTHGGEFLISDRLGSRTIELRLPAMSIAANGTSATTARERRVSVLVVDGEPMIRRALEILLRPDHDVTAVTSAGSALELLARSNAFDVVVFDLSRSEMSGSEFEARLQVFGPDIAQRVVYLTDDATRERDASFVQLRMGRNLNRPFTADRLVSLVAERARTCSAGRPLR